MCSTYLLEAGVALVVLMADLAGVCGSVMLLKLHLPVINLVAAHAPVYTAYLSPVFRELLLVLPIETAARFRTYNMGCRLLPVVVETVLVVEEEVATGAKEVTG